MGRSPARPTNFSNDEPRPGPAHQISVCWAAARPGHHIFEVSRPGPARPSYFRRFTARPGPARSINFSNFTARPGPAHYIFKILGPAMTSPGPKVVEHQRADGQTVYPAGIERFSKRNPFIHATRHGTSNAIRLDEQFKNLRAGHAVQLPSSSITRMEADRYSMLGRTPK